MPHLIRALGDPDFDVTSKAAEALAAIGDPRALAPIISAIPRLGARAVASLASIDPGWRQSAAYRQALPQLLACLGDRQSDMAFHVSEALLEAEEPEILPALAEAWGDPEACRRLRSLAIRAAAKGPAPGLCQALVSLLGEQPYAAGAAGALGRLFGRAALEPLVERLLVPGYFDFGIIRELERIDPGWRDTPEGSRAVSTLAARLQDKSVDVRRITFERLSALGYPIDLFASLLGDPDNMIRQKVWDLGRNAPGGWKKLGPEGVARLVAASAKSQQEEALKVLAMLEPRVLPLLQAGSELRYEAALVLGRFRREISIQPLIELLRDLEHPMREKAAIVLGRFDNEAVFAALVEALLRPESFYRHAVIFSLAAVGGPRARAPLQEYLGRSDNDRAMTELALAILPPASATLDVHDPGLLRCLADYWELHATPRADELFRELARRFPSEGAVRLIARDLSGYSYMEERRLRDYEDLLVQAGRNMDLAELRFAVRNEAMNWPQVSHNVAERVSAGRH